MPLDSNGKNAQHYLEPALTAQSEVAAQSDTGQPDERKRKLSWDHTAGGPSKRVQIVTESPTKRNVEEHVSEGHLRSTSHPAIEAQNAQTGDGSRTGFFHGSRDMMVQNSNMVEGTQNIYINERSTEALPWLQEHVIPGVEFDSPERHPPPRCQPGTRTDILRRCRDWLRNSKREKKLLWLRGHAGVGKSAIIQTLVESLVGDEQSGAGIFFSRHNKRTNLNQVFTSLAYQLAVRDPSYRSYIRNLMLSNPRSLSKALNEQFRILFTEPFARHHVLGESKALLIVLDGLDECNGCDWYQEHNYPGCHSDRSQCEIVQLISGFVLKHPSVPLVWIISSRPEPHLDAVFSREDVCAGIWEEDVAINSDEARRDIERFLHSKFYEIRRDHPEFMLSSTWPSNDKFLRIAKAAMGLFAFAALIIRFIGDPSVRNPRDQLNRAITFISDSTHTSSRQHPLAPLDTLYTQIFDKIIEPGALPVAKRLIVTASFYNDDDAPHYDLITICNMLGITRDSAVAALRHLRPIIQIPRNANELGESRLRCYHTSLSNYLEDQSRSNGYHIDKPTIGIELFRASFHIARALGSYDMRVLGEEFPNFHGLALSWLDDNPTSLKQLDGHLTEHALKVWECILDGEFSPSGLTLKYHTVTVIIPSDELQDFLENISIKKMVNISSRARHLLGSFHWNSIPTEEFTKRQFISSTTLNSLGLDKNLNPESITVMVDTLLGYVRIDFDEKPSEIDEETLAAHRYSLDSLFHSVQFAPDTPVTILGCDKDRCAISRVWDSDGFESTTYFITGFDTSSLKFNERG